MLKRRGIPHQVLNAKHHEREAEIIKLAGQPGAVTIATNMAGRGTDIVLGEGVPELGAFTSSGTERHESRRIDNQLRGRSGRQGDPRLVKVLRGAGGRLDEAVRRRVDLRADGADGMERRRSHRASPTHRCDPEGPGKGGGQNFEIRKQVLEYDDVMNKQREAIYALRKSVLAGENLKQMTADTIASVAEGLVRAHADEKMASSYWNVEALESEVAALLNAPGRPQLYHEGMGWRDLVKAVEELIRKAHAAPRGAFRRRAHARPGTRRDAYLIDSKWVDHLQAMDMLREGIGLRAYGQQDPLVEYKRESYAMFNDLLQSIGEDFVRYLLRIRIQERRAEGQGEGQEGQRVQRASTGPRGPETSQIHHHHQSASGVPANSGQGRGEGGQERSVPVRKRQEVQEVLRGAEIGSAPIARREDDPVRAELKRQSSHWKPELPK